MIIREITDPAFEQVLAYCRRRYEEANQAGNSLEMGVFLYAMMRIETFRNLVEAFRRTGEDFPLWKVLRHDAEEAVRSCNILKEKEQDDLTETELASISLISHLAWEMTNRKRKVIRLATNFVVAVPLRWLSN